MEERIFCTPPANGGRSADSPLSQISVIGPSLKTVVSLHCNLIFLFYIDNYDVNDNLAPMIK